MKTERNEKETERGGVRMTKKKRHTERQKETLKQRDMRKKRDNKYPFVCLQTDHIAS